MNTLTNVKKSQGIMMFIILLLSYIVFASNWVAGSNLSEKIVYFIILMVNKYHRWFQKL